jgi:hypothetical protein
VTITLVPSDKFRIKPDDPAVRRWLGVVALIAAMTLMRVLYASLLDRAPTRLLLDLVKERVFFPRSSAHDRGSRWHRDLWRHQFRVRFAGTWRCW